MVENEKSISGGSIIKTITILIVISLIIWQYALPYYDDTVKLPSEYLYEIYTDTFNIPEEDEVTFSIEFRDLVTNAIITPNLVPENGPDKYEHYTPTGHSYQMILKTNAPYTIYNIKYQFSIQWEFYNDTSMQYEVVNHPDFNMVWSVGFSSLYSDTWQFSTPVNSYTDFKVSVVGYTPNNYNIWNTNYDYPYVWFIFHRA